jgi:hypothetical protein
MEPMNEDGYSIDPDLEHNLMQLTHTTSRQHSAEAKRSSTPEVGEIQDAPVQQLEQPPASSSYKSVENTPMGSSNNSRDG